MEMFTTKLKLGDSDIAEMVVLIGKVELYSRYYLESEVNNAEGLSKATKETLYLFRDLVNNENADTITFSDKFVVEKGADYFSKQVSLWNRFLIWLFYRD